MDISAIKEFFGERDRFAKMCGVELQEVRPGYAKCRMAVKPEHLNGVDVVQGGAIFTLADLAFAAACNSHGTVAVAVNINITYMKGVAAGALTAEAVEEAKNPKLSTCHITVTDEQGDLVASFQGLAYRKKTTLKEVLAAQD